MSKSNKSQGGAAAAATAAERVQTVASEAAASATASEGTQESRVSGDTNGNARDAYVTSGGDGWRGAAWEDDGGTVEADAGDGEREGKRKEEEGVPEGRKARRNGGK